MSRDPDRPPAEVKYVYDLPYTVREKLCKILDINNCWEKLGGTYMGFTVTELEEIRRVERCGDSPTNRLLQLWGQQNHTVMQLFHCLWNMEHFQALRALQPCIDEKYHTLFLNDERSITVSISAKRPTSFGESRGQPLVQPNPYQAPTTRPSFPMSTPHNMPSQYSIPQQQPKPVTTAASHGVLLNQHTVSPMYSKAMHQTSNGNSSHLQEGPASLEGACALNPSHHRPASHHDAHNFNQGSTYPPSYPTSPKVPAALLYPPQNAVNTQQGVTVAGGMRQSATEVAGGIMQSVPGAAGVMTGAVGMKQGIAGTDCMKHSMAGVGGINQKMTGPGGMNQSVFGMGGMKQVKTGAGDLRSSVTGVGEVRHTASSNQHLPPASPPFQEPSRKINNYEGIGVNGVVSCEDNTTDGCNSSEKSHYDANQDLMNRLKAKEAKEAARQTEDAGLSQSINPVSHTLTQDSGLNNLQQPAPVSPPVARLSPQPTPDTNPRNAAAAATPLRKSSSSSCGSSVDGGPGGCSSSVPVIPYKELEEATALWNQHNLLGRGGFGAVFKGMWKNTEVAVKRIEPHGNASHDDTRLHISQSLEELKLLQSYRHDNILQVYGYSMDHEQYPCLVYQFMPNGSVEDRLQGRKIEALGVSGWSSSYGSWSQRGLTWKQRYRVAWGTAKALQFLHTVKDKPLIHGDVKSANILLDQNYEPKLGDFGLAREGKSQSTSIKVSRVHGTKPYLPDDYLRHKKLSVKVDTYSYGVVLFELCTGLRAYDEKRKGGPKLLRELVEEADEPEALRDSSLGGRPDDGIFKFLYELGKKCVHTLSTRRPDMKAVFEELGNFAILLERAQARRISRGESSSGCSTPHHLQICYDTAGSLQGHSPTPSPSMQPPSFPNFHPSSLSAVSPLPPSPSPVSPAHSPAPPSHFPHVNPHYTPQYPSRPTPQFCPHPQSHYPPGAVLRQGQLSPGAHFPPRFLAHPQVTPAGHDPPSYSETMSQGPGVMAGMMGGAGAVVRPGGMIARLRLPAVGSALVPDFATLNMNNTSYSSESSNYLDSDSSLAASTTHNISVRQDPLQSLAGNMMPLLTALGTKDDGASSSSQLTPVSSGRPTAASKTFGLD